jgi:hypothetical protein
MADYLSKAEFSRAVAQTKQMLEDETLDLVAFMKGDMVMFGGFALPDFEPVTCNMVQLCQLIAYQTLCFNGQWDQVALQEIWAARRKFLLVGPGSDEVVADQQRRFHYRQQIEQLAGVA